MIPTLHLVTNDRILARPDFVDRAVRAVEAGTGQVALHLRGPDTPPRRLWELGREIAPAASDHGVTFVVNDRIDIAMALRTEGAHLGARSVPVRDARWLLGPDALIGASVHGPDEAALLNGDSPGQERPDYVFAGPVFRTASHPGMEPVGAGIIERVGRELEGIPVLAIGGVTAERVSEVAAGGAVGVAVVRAIWDAGDPEAALHALLDALADSLPMAAGGWSRSADG